MPNDSENTRTPPQLTEYEQRLLDSLRAERRGRLGMAAVHAAPAPAEPPKNGTSGEPETLVVAERSADVMPAPEIDDVESPARPALDNVIPLTRHEPAPIPAEVAVPYGEAASFDVALRSEVASVYRSSAARPVSQGSRWQLGLLIGAVPVAVFLAVFLLVPQQNAVRPPAPVADNPDAARIESAPGRADGPVTAKAAPGPFDNLITETGGAEVVEPPVALGGLFTAQAEQPGGKERFRTALQNTAPSSPARLSYLEVASDRVRLRGSPVDTGTVLQTVRSGSYVQVKERSVETGWCQVRVPEGRAGWMKCEFLKPIAEFSIRPNK